MIGFRSSYLRCLGEQSILTRVAPIRLLIALKQRSIFSVPGIASRSLTKKISLVSWSKVGNGSRGKLGTKKSRGPAAALRPILPTTCQCSLTHQHQTRCHYEAQYSLYALLCLGRFHEPAMRTTPLKTPRDDSTTRQAKYRTLILMLFLTET